MDTKLKELVSKYEESLEESKDSMCKLDSTFAKQYYRGSIFNKAIVDTLNKINITEVTLKTLRINSGRGDSLTEQEVADHMIACIIEDILRYQPEYNTCNHAIDTELSLIRQGKIKALLEYTKEWDLFELVKKYSNKRIKKIDVLII